MKSKIVFTLMVTVNVLLCGVVFSADQTINSNSPSVFFSTQQHDFAPVVEGTIVNHEFVIQNKGSATLEIERVKTG